MFRLPRLTPCQVPIVLHDLAIAGRREPVHLRVVSGLHRYKCRKKDALENF